MGSVSRRPCGFARRRPSRRSAARRATLSLSLALLASALTIAALLAAAAPPGALAQDAEAAGTRLRALVAGDADSPVVDALKRQLGNRLRFRRRSQIRPRALHRYDLLVVDGDELSPRRMARRKVIGRFTRTDRWVLGLDLRSGHHSRAIVKQTEFEALSADGHRSDAFMFRRAPDGTTPQVDMLDAERLRPYGAGQVGKRKRRRLSGTQTRRVARTIVAAVAGGGASASGVSGSDDDCFPRATLGDSGLPAELQHVGWTYCQMGSQIPPDGYWTSSGQLGLVEPPAPGKQTASWTLNHDFDVYLDNGDGRPQGNRQIVTYNIDGQFSPKRNAEKFFQMFDRFTLAGGTYDDPLERAWWTGSFGLDVQPAPAADSVLVWQASEPQTPNAETSYTAGQSFSVGFTGSKEGAEVNAAYSVNNEKSYSVPDWGVQNNTVQNELNWLYSSRNPCDVRQGHFDQSRCFSINFGENGTPVLPNELSRGQLQIHASGRWRTRGVLDPQNGRLDFTIQSGAILGDTVCELWVFLGYYCNEGRRALRTTPVGPVAQSYGLDASIVNPIPVKSLDLSPDPADGSKKEDVTGTVTLERNAPMDVTVVIYSSSQNAVVGGPSGQGSQRAITIDKGKASETFRVQTNDNNLRPGQHTTAAITAFYTEPTTKQLTINARKGS